METEVIEQFKTMSVAFLFGVPAVIGAITVYFGNESQKTSRLFRIFMPWVTILAFLLTTLITYLEASVCVVMLLPAFLLFASIGGITMGEIIDSSKRKKQTLNIFLTLPFLFAPLESQFNSPTSFRTVHTDILIHADKQTVWDNIKSVNTIKDDELKWSFAHFIGIPKPIKSELSEEKVGGIRHISWEKGIKFREKITHWKPYDSFSYDILVDHIPPDAIDKHVEVGGEYFDVVNGGYKLTEVDKSTTKLTLSCTYRVTTNFNYYSEQWADFIMDDFQEVILYVVKKRSEDSYLLPTAKSK
ncbi:hypothetical protein [Sabulibacter ruber]|uniref:hypothetical protein n=1 Tax=Sabulibacter ruber TaxID=2811901 RepID=UPI001A95AFDA|nr:hypothetical protein [Sabulibacter ruber]